MNATWPLTRAGTLTRASTQSVRPLAWLIPDVALLLSLLTFFYCLFLFDGFHKLFRDSDTGWHIRAGQAILHSGRLPYVDTYSLLRSGQPWMAWEWLADAIMGALHSSGGLAAVAAFYAAVIAACTWFWFRLHWAVGGNFLFACAMAPLLLTTCSLHWLARPHVLSWVLLTGLVWWCESGTPSPRSYLPVAALAALWANLHASFFLSPAILLIYALGHTVRPLIWELETWTEIARAKNFLVLSAIALAATFLNPYGWRLHEHVIRYLNDRELLDRIGEFQSFNFHAEGAAQILLTVVLGIAGGVLAIGQRQPAQAALAFLFTGLALRSARALPLVALLILPLANGAITAGLQKSRGWNPAVRGRLEQFLLYSANLRTLDRQWRGWATLAVIAILFAAWLPAAVSRAGFPADQFPVQASVALARLPSGARVLAPDKFGGYLIYRFSGERKVYFDGRSDFYGSEFMKSYLRLIELREGWREQIRAAGFTHALLPNSYSLIPALRELGWKTLYRDEVSTLLESR